MTSFESEIFGCSQTTVRMLGTVSEAICNFPLMFQFAFFFFFSLLSNREIIKTLTIKKKREVTLPLL